jgi:hypothetical protein
VFGGPSLGFLSCRIVETSYLRPGDRARCGVIVFLAPFQVLK